MARLFFVDDYSEGAHPALLEAITAANEGAEEGYGADRHSRRAAELIRQQLGRDADVHLVSGGTQANLICLAAVLRPHEGVIAATTGHINVHETGAIEATGHRIIAVDGDAGRLTREALDRGLATHEDEHSVRPRAVFLSQATEAGTVYPLADLTSLTEYAHERGLLVYLDGARLAPALAALGATLEDVGRTGIDMLYLGGTKNGGLFGEAIVILTPDLRPDFRYHMKQRGALMAKGRWLGAQFERFFRDDLWYRLGADSVEAAQRLASGLRAGGVELAAEPQANQVFAVVTDETARRLATEVAFHRWTTTSDGRVVIRLVCSWATRRNDIDRLVGYVTANA